MKPEKLLDEDEKREPIDTEVVADFQIKPIKASVVCRQFDYGRDLVIRLYRLCEGRVHEDKRIKLTENLRPEDLRKASRVLQQAADEIQNLKTTRHDKQ